MNNSKGSTLSASASAAHLRGSHAKRKGHTAVTKGPGCLHTCAQVGAAKPGCSQTLHTGLAAPGGLSPHTTHTRVQARGCVRCTWAQGCLQTPARLRRGTLAQPCKIVTFFGSIYLLLQRSLRNANYMQLCRMSFDFEAVHLGSCGFPIE